MELAIQAAVKSTQKTLWQFWSELLQKSKGSFYTHQNFFELVDEMTGTSDLSTQLKTLSDGQVRGTLSDSSVVERFFLQLLEAVGTNSSMPEHVWPQWYHQVLGEKAIASIESADCGDAGSFESLTQAGAYVFGSASCHGLVRPMLIKKVGEFDIFSQAVQAYDLIRQRCSSGSRLALVIADSSDTIEATCPQLPTRPNYIELIGMAGL